jgi:hypothetical protein
VIWVTVPLTALVHKPERSEAVLRVVAVGRLWSDELRSYGHGGRARASRLTWCPNSLIEKPRRAGRA